MNNSDSPSPPVIPPTIPVELLPPESVEGPTQPPRDGKNSAPFHPAAVVLMLIVDNLWMLEEFVVITWVVTVPLSFLSVFLPALWIQHRLTNDTWKKAAMKALFLGLVAAVPTSITGTPVGLALLAWAGIRRSK